MKRSTGSTWLILVVLTGGLDKATAANQAAEPVAPLAAFNPPPLAELDAKAEWVAQEVVDPLARRRAQEAKEPRLATVEEAIGLENDSVENNAKIVGALGKLPGTDAEVNWDATISRHTAADVKSTNPIMYSSTIEFEVQDILSLNLFGFDWEMKPFALADVVASWHTSKDHLVDKLILRDDLTWSDGHPLTAHDVAFSFQAIMNPKVPVPAARTGTDQLRWVHAYDDRTLVFFHKAALATNIWNMLFPIIPKHKYEQSILEDPTLQDSKYHVDLENKPVSSGPYKIARRTRGQEIVLSRRESFYMHNGKQVRAKPHFKLVRFRVLEDPNTALLALKSGQLDELMLTPEQWTTQTGNDEFYKLSTKATGLEWVTFSFVWNCKTPYFSDKRVRRAMSYAFNHQEMLDNLCYGLYEPCNGIFHPTAWMAPRNPPKPYKQDLDEAERLLDEAGWEDHDNDGVRDKEIAGRSVPFEFTVLTSQVPLRIAICTLLKENLGQIGITCNVRPLEFTTLTDLHQKHKFQASFGAWGTGTDPETLENLFGTGKNRNYGEYSNPEVDRLFELGRQELDRAKRAEIYAKIHLLLYDDQTYSWLYYRSSFYGFSKTLRGYRFSPRGLYNYYPGFRGIWRTAAN